MSALLKEMFPHFDNEVLESVLQAVNGNTDNAVEMLLSMDAPPQKPNISPASQPKETVKVEQPSITMKIESISVSGNKIKVDIEEIQLQLSSSLKDNLPSIMQLSLKKLRPLEEQLVQHLLQLDSFESQDTDIRTKRKQQADSLNALLKQIDQLKELLTKAPTTQQEKLPSIEEKPTEPLLYTKQQASAVDLILSLDDYYKVLGLERKFTEGEIKHNYKTLAMIFHPDKNKAPRSQDAFKHIAEAYCCLSDPILRENYDQLGKAQVQPEVEKKASEEVERLKALLYAELWNSLSNALFSSLFNK